MRPVRLAVAALLVPGLAGCWTQQVTGSPGSGGTAGSAPLVQRFQIIPTRDELDLVFVIDDSAAGPPQQKLLAQVPTFLQVLENLPRGLPDIHIGIVSGDMGAGADGTAGCAGSGDGGRLRASPTGTCQATTLTPNATFISDSGSGANFSAPIETVVQCIALLGTGGCSFQQPLAALARALGADGSPPPDGNQGFLRDNAVLGIVVLSGRDDCSGPPDSSVFKADTGAPGLLDPTGPLTPYRCNRAGHLCADAGGPMRVPPPLVPPAAGASIAQLTCWPNERPDGLVRPTELAARIRALKDAPDDRIYVSAIVAPADPYGVTWKPAGAANPQNPNELWPSVLLSCGAAGGDDVNPATMRLTSDGSQGEPALRIAEFVQGFSHGVVASICDPSYAATMGQLAKALGDLTRGVTCSGTAVPSDARGQPRCTVVAEYLDATNNPVQRVVPNCNDIDATAPCWQASEDDRKACPAGGRPIAVSADRRFQSALGLIYDVSCEVCDTTTSVAGCR